MSEYLPDIIEEHIEEACFLWAHYHSAAYAANYHFEDLKFIEQRMQAHVDGFMLAPTQAKHLALDILTMDSASHFFVCAIICLGAEDDIALFQLLQAIAEEHTFSAGVVDAFAFVDKRLARLAVNKLLQQDDELYQILGLLAWHRIGGKLSQLQKAMNLSQANEFQPIILRLIGEQADEINRVYLFHFLESKDPHLQLEAARALSLFREYRGVEKLKQLCDHPDVDFDDIASVLMRVLAHQEAVMLVDALISRRQIEKAIAAIHHFADPRYVPYLLIQMLDKQHYAAACHAFFQITGILGKDECLLKTLDEIDGFGKLSPQAYPEYDLAKLENWWQQQSTSYKTGVRHFMGQILSPELVVQALQYSRQSHRHWAAKEFALMDANNPLLDVAEPCRLQHMKLAGVALMQQKAQTYG
ncbi:MAG: hypothetical protein OEZ58_18595 [Gammaproteobacteria bacterium]|nr:hypothetical protein [Gammaproteobacteria bacterium]